LVNFQESPAGPQGLISLLTAVALKQIHWIHRYCVASHIFLVHGGLLLHAIDNDLPLYTRNHIVVITQYVVFRRVE